MRNPDVKKKPEVHNAPSVTWFGVIGLDGKTFSFPYSALAMGLTVN